MGDESDFADKSIEKWQSGIWTEGQAIMDANEKARIDPGARRPRL
jgi:hypothetical protein